MRSLENLQKPTMQGVDVKEVSDSERGEKTGDKINRLSAVFKGPSYMREGLLFIGWTKEGNPMVSDNQNSLGEIAKRSFGAFRMSSGLRMREIGFTQLTPVEYGFTGEAIDFADTGPRKAEDLITYNVKDGKGEAFPINLGEREVLRSITEARIPWQDIGPSSVGNILSSAKKMYTLVVPNSEMGPNSATVILFQPPIEGESNEAVFKSFVRQTIGRLLVLDESQKLENQKGYLKAAAKFAGVRGTSMTDVLVNLVRAGLVEFSDESVDRLKQSMRNLAAKGLSVISRLFVEINPDAIERLRHTLPVYDVDKLDIEQLFRLSEAMLEVAYSAIGRN